ncbi:MAG: lactate utilization protein [Bacteroidales bacterium]|nr:lactate utilization protein [Bacteroidales bacterium]
MKKIDYAKVDWQDETLWLVRGKRDRLAKALPEWEALRDAASRIKLYSNSHLPELLEQFETRAIANGAVVHWAKDAAEYRQIIGDLLTSHGVRHFVKSKSMLSEECGLRPYLESLGIETVETDLGERIIQLLGSRPSHIVLPAIHVKREEVGALFEKEMGTEPGNSDPTYLTHAARRNLREHFLHADAAMTGANFAVASTGEIVVCTNEGNADMGTSIPPLQIAAFGIDKIVPDRESLGVFTRLLARTATGQPITTYTTHYSAPRKGSEFHIVIVDNGRSSILADREHFRLLNCLRCGGCMNTCPVYRRIGGYAYSYFIPGPVGINLGMQADPKKHKGNLSACTLCHSCSVLCPAKVDLADQIYRSRQHYATSARKKLISKGMTFVMNEPWRLNAALGVAPLGMRVLKGLGFSWGKGRAFPDIPSPKKTKR